MQSVRTYHEIEVTDLSTLERDPNPISVVHKLMDGVVQDQFTCAVKRLIDHGRQVRPGDAHVPLRRPHDRGRLDRTHTVPGAIDRARLGEHVTAAPQFRNDAHPLRHVEAGAPEVDQVTTAAKLGRPLYQGDFMPRVQQPVPKRRTGYSSTHNQHLHDYISLKPMVRPSV